MPLGPYIKNTFRFWYYAFFSACCRNLEKKILGHWENLRKSGGQSFKGSKRKVSNLVLWQLSSFRYLLVTLINKQKGLGILRVCKSGEECFPQLPRKI